MAKPRYYVRTISMHEVLLRWPGVAEDARMTVCSDRAEAKAIAEKENRKLQRSLKGIDPSPKKKKGKAGGK
jgi:hypothetical protein